MMSRCLLFCFNVFGLLFIQNSIAQSVHSDEPLHRVFKNNIKVTPLKIIGAFHPSLELRYERITGSKYSSSAMFAWMLPHEIPRYGEFFHRSGYRIGLEERKYFRQKEEHSLYMSLQMDYLFEKYQTIKEFGPNRALDTLMTDSTYYQSLYQDTVAIQRSQFSLNIRLGYQLNYKRFVLDVYGGIGLKYRNVSQSHQTNPADKQTPAIDVNLFRIFHEPGKYWTISLPLNFSIGFAF